jgi:anti-anti-sigma factor
VTRSNHCRVEVVKDTIVVTPVRNIGELDYQRFYADVNGVIKLLEQKRASNVIIDFCRTRMFGSDAVYLFLKLRRQVQANRGRMALCGLSHYSMEILTVMGLERLWPVAATRCEAMSIVKQRPVDILVVDDSEVDRRLVGGLLSRHPDYNVRYADSGRSGLSRMRDEIPDLVITDLIMPETNGLELVAAVRQMYPQVPVILMTAYGNEAIAIEALERGAASYVPKSQQADRLLDTVARVLARIEAHRYQTHLRGCPAKLDCSFYLDSDPAMIPPLVDLVQQNLAVLGAGDTIDQIRIGIALEEALMNALLHGNLEISSKELNKVRRESSYEGVCALTEQRRRRMDLKDRRIVVDVHITSHTARFVIRDEGAGFDRSSARRSAHDCFEKGNNRGSMLMYTLMDEVMYNDKGNEVTLIKVP